MMKPHYRMTSDGTVLPAIRAADGFQNLVANLGTSRDKAHSNSYVVDMMTHVQLLNAYRGSSVARAVVDVPAEDACREWRMWNASKEQIEALEAEEIRLGLIYKVLDARRRARLYGGSAIYIGTDDANVNEPLDPEKIQKGGIKYLTVFDRHELGAQDLQLDPRLPGYGLPRSYQLNGAGGAIVDIHPTRFIMFRGDEIPNNALQQASSGWGDSVLQTALEKIGHLDATVANVASLVFEAKIDVVKIKDFTQNLRDGGDAYERLMLKRFGLAMTAKGVNGTLMLDAEEEYSQKSASFTTLPDILDRFAQMVSAASEIPMTRLFGISPGGMNSTGESDMRNYYDCIKREQTLDIGPAMRLFDECLVRSSLGSRPDEVHYVWRSLWQMNEKMQSEVAAKLTEAAERMDNMGAAPTEAIGKALTNAVTELGAFPGLETAIEEYGEDGEIDPNTGEIVDAKPCTLYVYRKVTNAADIIKWAKDQGFKTTLPADDMHVTIAYSRDPINWMKAGEAWTEEVKIAKGGPRMVENFGDNARVLLFASSHLSWRHEEIKRAGASWDYPEYQPHITISYNEDAPDLSDVEPYTGEIVLGPEIFSEVKSGWSEGVKEE